MRSLILFLVLTGPVLGREFSVSDKSELDSAISNAQPGDTLVLQDGQWRDQKIEFTCQGNESLPITLRAANPGKVVFTGTSTLRIGGRHLVVDGLFFKDPDPSVSDLIQFRKDSKQSASHCRLTNCAVTSTLAASSSDESRWVGLYGEGHRVDHCSFEGKSGKGTTFVVWLGGENVGGHRIDHNYFGYREKLGRNGGETIRVGDSATSMLRGNCLVENNRFEKCNGEAECISNKSCGNVYRANAFLEVSGTLTLRHGNGCLVENNVFLGSNASGTGGIRVIGEDHIVRGNFLHRLTGDDARSAITLMMGIPNSRPERYFQVKNARVENNTIVECKHPILIGLSDDENATLEPIDSLIVGNQVWSPKYEIVEARCELDGIQWSENRFAGKSLGISDPPAGITFVSEVDPNQVNIVIREVIPRSEVGIHWIAP